MLVGYEMMWTVRYFAYNKEVWEGRRNTKLLGPAVYVVMDTGSRVWRVYGNRFHGYVCGWEYAHPQ
jgi:hypothetical protein